MPSSFWNSWQLWEKMCFVLGSSIVVVICLGCLKLMYNHWRLRKYTAIAATKVALRQEMQHSASVRRGRAGDIPFGVRALESGVEVDGVWISGTNTPASSMPGSPELVAATSPLKPAQRDRSLDRTSSSNMSHIEIPRPIHGHSEIHVPTGNPFQHHSSAFDGTSPSETSHKPHMMSSERYPYGRPTYQPRRSSHLRFSNSFDPDHNDALAALEGRPTTANGKGKRPEGPDTETEEKSRSGSWSRSSDNDGQDSLDTSRQSKLPADEFMHPAYHNPPHVQDVTAFRASQPLTSQRSYVLDDDRNFSGKSPDGLTLLQKPVEGFNNTKSSSPVLEAGDPFVTPVATPSEDHLSKLSLDLNAADYHVPMIKDDSITYTQGHALPLQPFDANRQERQSQVVRKINSAFEILRPGTLDRSRQSSDISEGKLFTAIGDKRQPRKLQRKKRVSSGTSSIEMA